MTNAELHRAGPVSRAVPVITAVSLLAGLILAVVVGPQTRSWTWGPSLVALGVSLATAMPVFWSKHKSPSDFGMLAFGFSVAGWFAWRACNSPVADLGDADVMLLTAAVGAFICIRAIEENDPAEKILIWGVALLLLANSVVVGIQVGDPTFSPIFRSRAAEFPSGFYSHYNEAANYLIASSLLVGAAALSDRHGRATRAIWALIAIAGMAAVYFTRSRGGILGGAVGCGVLACGALVIGKRSGAKWFPIALTATPLLGLFVAMFLFSGWKDSQEIRQGDTSVEHVLDNSSRLFLLGIAASCIALHPMAGGGSRSFSWESFRFYDVAVQGGTIARKPEQVHNEIVQAATDYGLIGAGLLIGLLAWSVGSVVIHLLFSQNSETYRARNCWRLGGLAAFAGMLVQSCFSFVFHLLPGVLLLGMCLGLMCRSSESRGKTAMVVGSKTVLSLALIACLCVVVPRGWKGAEVTKVLWPTYFSKDYSPSLEAKADALTEAIHLWPQSLFYKERATAYQAAAVEAGADSAELLDKAIEDYRRAGRLHPLDAGIAVNLANLHSQKQQDEEAETAYQRAIQLQGGGETAFQSRFSFANHLVRKAHREFDVNDPVATLVGMEEAAQQMEQSVKEMRWTSPNIYDARVTVHENLGAAREANGDYKGAMAAYDFGSGLLGGTRVHYRAGLLFGKKAASAWTTRRPAEALTYFIEAKRRIGMAAQLPKDIQPSQRLEYLDYLDRSIAFLKGAKIDPIPLPKD